MGRRAVLIVVVAGAVGLAGCAGGVADVRSKNGVGVSASGDSAPTSGVVTATTDGPATTPGASTTVITVDDATTTSVVVETTLSVLPDDSAYPLQEGSTGPEVERLQRALERAGYDVGISRVDGGFGPDTASGVRMFQRVTGRRLTGVVDRPLMAAIEAAPAAPMFVLTGNGIGAVRLGDDPDSVVTYLTERLGPPDNDDGWEAAIGPCNLTEMRIVGWHSLAVVFGDYSVATAAEGPRQLIQVATSYLDGPVPDPRIRTDAGLRAGDTVTKLLRLYPTAETFPDDGMFGPSYNVPDEFHGSIDPGAPDRVTNILVGLVPCGE